MTLPIISLILPHLFDIARTVVRDEIADPSAPIRSEAPAAAADRVAREIVKEVQRIPEVQHVTSSEPHWYQQRSKWSAIVSGILVVAAPLVARFGLAVSPELQEVIVTACTTVGGLVAAYLAYRAGTASRPLGA
jgi:hypothetical protein